MTSLPPLCHRAPLASLLAAQLAATAAEASLCVEARHASITRDMFA